MNRKIITVVALGMLLVSCVISNQKYDESSADIHDALENKNLISIDLDKLKTDTTIHTSEIFKKVKTIILETNKDNLIGRINSFQVFKDTIFILDSDRSKGLYLFNMNGKYLRKIGSVGQGPGEYNKPIDFTIDKINRWIYIVDFSGGKILKYDLKSGKYIKNLYTKRNKQETYSIQCVGEKLFGDLYEYPYISENSLLQELNTFDGEHEKKWLSSWKYHKKISDVQLLGSKFYDRNQDAPKFIQTFMDVFMTFDKKGNVMPYLELKSNNLLSTDDLAKLEGNKFMQMSSFINSGKIFYFQSLVTSKNLVYLEYRQKIYMKHLLYNTATKKTRLAYGLTDDLVFDTSHNLPPILVSTDFRCATADGFISVIDPSAMTSFIKQVKAGRLAKNLDKRDQLMKLNADANPVIFVYSN